MQQLTINVYQHALPLRMLNTWIKTKFHLTPLPQGSSLTIKWKEMICQQGRNTLTASVAPQCSMPVLYPEVFCHFFSTQKVVKFQKTYWGSKLNFHLMGKIRISIKLFLSIGVSTCCLQLQMMHFQKWSFQCKCDKKSILSF